MRRPRIATAAGRPEAAQAPRSRTRRGRAVATLLVVGLALLLTHESASPYLAFAERHGDGVPLAAAELDRRVAEADATPPRSLGLDPAQIGERTVEALGFGFLIEDLSGSSARAVVRRERRRKGFTELRLLFPDREVGSFTATLLLPDRAGPRPAVLGLHGHRSSDREFARRYLGERLARSGYAVLMPRFRAMACSRGESRAARELLARGLTLMGLHVYESLVALRYLETREEVDPARIGVLGHSGGSSIATLVARVAPRVDALVVDYRVDFRNQCGPGLHCETVPGLHELALDIHNGPSSVPRMLAAYGLEAPGVQREVEVFLDRHLSP